MRTALHTWSFRNRYKEDESFTVFDALNITAELGFTGFEVMTGKANMPPEHISGDSPEHLAKVMKHAQSVGVAIDCLSTYNDFAYVRDEAWRLANIEYIKTWLKIAGDLGVPNIRMLTGYYIDGEDRARLEELTHRGIAECVPVAEAAGVNMAIENHNSIFFQADEIIGLIKEFGSKRLTACPDPSNWGGKEFWDADCPDDVHRHVLDSAAKLAPYATQSHLKIRGFTNDDKLIGFGDDLDTLLRSYKAAGYDGPLAFECVVEDADLIAPLPKARQIVEQALQRVGA